jgi:RHS repeat-associated protein
MESSPFALTTRPQAAPAARRRAGGVRGAIAGLGRSYASLKPLYDGDGRVCAVASTSVYGDVILTGYVYNPGGQRVSKGTITTWSCDPAISGFTATNDYVLGPSGEQVTEMAMGANKTMSWQHTNVYAAGNLFATYDNNGLHFHFNDELGTRRVQTDYAGVMEQTCSGLPFGDSLDCSNSIQFPTEHHFTGKERDTESGNDYFGARYYSNYMGRFMSPDWSAKASAVPYAKLDNPQTLNLYQYMRNNPLSGVDPDGHSPDWWQKLVNGVSGNGFQTNAQLHPAPAVSTMQGPGTANPFTVTLNSRPADIPGGKLLSDAGANHQWISTSDGKSGGMGTAAGVPQSDAPGVATQVVDHTGQVPTSTQTFTGVDPTAINSYLQPGQATGPWLPGANDCNTWAANAITQSTPHDIVSGLGDPVFQVNVIHNAVVYSDGSVHQVNPQ